MSKRDIIDLSSDDEDETPMKIQKTEEITTDIQVHNELIKRFGPRYFDRFSSTEQALELVKALVEFGYPPSFIADYLQNTYWEVRQPIYDQGDCTIDHLTLADTPNYFYKYPVQEKPKVDLRKVHKDLRPIFEAIQKIKSKKCTPIQYTGTVPLSDSAKSYIHRGYRVNTAPYKY